MSDRYVTPSKITAWLDCTHFLALKHQVEDGTMEPPAGGMGSFAELLAEKGLQHERDCLAALIADGKTVFEVPEREKRESFTAWVKRIGNPFDLGYDVIYQMPLMHDGIRGIADFLIRLVDDAGTVSWEPVDAKLARKAAKPGHVLQLCFYADAIEAGTGRRPERMHLWLGSGAWEPLVVQEFRAYWRRLRSQLATVIDAPTVVGATQPEPCNHCAFCEFAQHCDDQWRAEDALHYVAGLRSADRSALVHGGVSTLADLASRPNTVEGLGPERFTRVRTQAQLQVEARDNPEKLPPHLRIEPLEDPAWGHGLETLPAPDDGDVFLDFEGHPFWTAQAGLFFLFGLIELEEGEWTYRTWWAHDPAEETLRAGELIDYLTDRRARFPGMHVYHYNHTERSSLESLARDRGVGVVKLAELVDTGAFVDLFLVARNAFQVGTESYGLKALEKLAGYQRVADIESGAGAVVDYELWMKTKDHSALDRIAAYNEDDVRATWALREWLVARRPAELAWRPAEVLAEEDLPELDEQITALHAFAEDTVEHLLGDLLGYWRREWRAHLAPLLARCSAPVEDLLEEPEALGGLVSQGVMVRMGARGKEITPALRLRFPPQEVSGLAPNDGVLFTTPDGEVGNASVVALDVASSEIDLMWNQKCVDLDHVPTTVVRNGWVPTKPKPQALSELAAAVLDPARTPPSASMALLRRDLPRFLPGCGPTGGTFSDDLEEMLSWATDLDGSCVAIQGPPGTGKTYRGAQLIYRLIKANKRVGITAMSHHAIDNLLEAAVEVFECKGESDLLHAVKRGPYAVDLEGVAHAKNPAQAARAEYNLIAGTSWLFAGNDLAAAPVDVLLIDEAGQLSLVDALAACRSAENVILLGDPQQLPQVAQASHPGGSGRSVLEHVLGGEATISVDRGAFLAETRRMHPDVCQFISEEIYQGRLTSHPSCHGQATEFGTGLRWLQAHHADRVTESEEEADLVLAQIHRLLGTMWTDQHGIVAPLGVEDVLVVAPYNDQVNLLRARVDADPATRGVRVGTVDKFQGRQAAVVLFTMATSTAADMVRSAEFLFSRNRFNVAISRARCLAYLVCTESLLNSRGRDVEEMRLISTLCAFAERAEVAQVGGVDRVALVGSGKS